MKKILLIVLSFSTAAANAQSYLISFAGSGASSAVTYVKVENLRTGATLQVNGNDILRLNITTGIADQSVPAPNSMKLYPNPMSENTNLEIYPPSPGNAVISVIDLNGKVIIQENIYLESCTQLIRLGGIKRGINLLTVKGQNYLLSDLLISNSAPAVRPVIEKQEAIIAAGPGKTESWGTKGGQATIDMDYTAGDWLKFMGVSKSLSATYATVRTDRPASDKTITFFFVDCTDGDGNHYPVVQVGNYLWMAENLKTTKLNDGTVVPPVTDNFAWKDLVSPGYCWYNNDISNKNVYGALYNFYAVGTGKLCPSGWHAGSDAEWTTLINDMGGIATAGNKLKDSGTDYWLTTTGLVTNESGFTILPAGTRYIQETDGGIIFTYLRTDAVFWTGNYPYSRSFYNYTPEVFRGSFGNHYSGFSVRCVKD